MFSWSELAQQLQQQLQQIIHIVVRFIKARRRDEGASFGLAALFYLVGYSFSKLLPPELMEFLKPWHVVLIAQIICYVVGSLLLVYSGVRLWRLVHVPD